MPAGRPTKYSKEMLKKAEDYIKNHKDYGDPVPIAAGLACELDVTKKTLYLWAQEYPDFLHTLDKLNQAQERKLSSGALDGDLQPTIAKLMLANHGYHEKQELMGKDGKDLVPDKIQIEFVDASKG